jgi:hypothetical protein
MPNLAGDHWDGHNRTLSAHYALCDVGAVPQCMPFSTII